MSAPPATLHDLDLEVARRVSGAGQRYTAARQALVRILVTAERPLTTAEVVAQGDGLPQSSAEALVQTQDGYVWIGTQEGLVRFDGARFTTYDRRNTPELRHNSILSLAEAPDGTLWAGTNGGGILLPTTKPKQWAKMIHWLRDPARYAQIVNSQRAYEESLDRPAQIAVFLDRLSELGR